jgi:phosphatidylethanolamine-binding protein (PEBP) family uncharacterized protein
VISEEQDCRQSKKMPTWPTAITILLLPMAIGALYGCGGSETVTSQLETSTVVEGNVKVRPSRDHVEDYTRQARPESSGYREETLVVRGPVSAKGVLPPPRIPPGFVCDDSKVWLPLRWGLVPRKTKELAVAIVWSNIERSKEGMEAKVFEIWIMGGLNPSTQQLYVGQLPKDAFVTIEHHHYPDPCSTFQAGEHQVTFRVYALPELNILNHSDLVTIDTLGKLEDVALAKGTFTGTYRQSYDSEEG